MLFREIYYSYFSGLLGYPTIIKPRESNLGCGIKFPRVSFDQKLPRVFQPKFTALNFSSKNPPRIPRRQNAPRFSSDTAHIAVVCPTKDIHAPADGSRGTVFLQRAAIFMQKAHKRALQFYTDML